MNYVGKTNGHILQAWKHVDLAKQHMGKIDLGTNT